MLNKDKLVYISTTPSQGDSVASFLHASNKLTSTTIGGKECLDVALGGVADDAVDSGTPLKVGSRAVGGALSAVSDSGDRADLISDLYRRIWVNNSPNIAGSNAAVSVDDTSGGVVIFASVLAARTRVSVQNLGDSEIYLGFGTVSSSNGIRLASGATFSEELGPDIILKGISGSGLTNDVRVMQLA